LNDKNISFSEFYEPDKGKVTAIAVYKNDKLFKNLKRMGAK